LKTKIIRLLSVALAAMVLIAGAASCGGQPSGGSAGGNDAAAAQTTAAATTAAATTAAETTAAAAETTAAAAETTAAKTTAAATTAAATTAAATEATTAESAVPAEKLEISIFWTDVNTNVDRNDNPVKTLIEEKTNSSIKFYEAASNEWKQKLALMFNAGDAPDLIRVGWGEISLVNQFGLDDLLQEWDPIIAKMPNVNDKVSVELRNNFRAANGKLYGLPSPRDVGTQAIFIRTDWLENLGLPAPKTLDDYYNTINAFRNDDPDQNGQKDTWGVMMGINEIISGPFGLPAWDWVEEGGNISMSAVHPRMKEALAFGAQIIKEDLGSPDFAVTGYNQDELISAGKGGIFTGVSSGAAAMLKNIQAENPNGHLAVLEVPKAPGVEQGVSSYAGISCVRNGHPMGIQCLLLLNADFPANKLDRLAQFIDWHFTVDGNLAQTYGIEGVTYELRDGKPYILENYQNDPLYLRQMGAWDVYLYCGYITQLENWDQLWAPEAAANMFNTMLMAVPKAVYFNTITGDEHGNEMRTKRDEVFTQIVLGTVGLDEGWDQWISEWKRIGGEQWTSEMNERYHQMK